LSEQILRRFSEVYIYMTVFVISAVSGFKMPAHRSTKPLINMIPNPSLFTHAWPTPPAPALKWWTFTRWQLF